MKFNTAKDVCSKRNIELVQKNIDITEIQEEDAKKVAIDKANKAYDIIQKPVVITDDSWGFTGLNGFPGVYMHSVNEWFSAEDFLRLTLPLKNREVIFTQHLIYSDGQQQKVFKRTSKGTLLKEIRGESSHPCLTIISLDRESGKSIAESYDPKKDKSGRIAANIWREFLDWYQDVAT